MNGQNMEDKEGTYILCMKFGHSLILCQDWRLFAFVLHLTSTDHNFPKCVLFREFLKFELKTHPSVGMLLSVHQ